MYKYYAPIYFEYDTFSQLGVSDKCPWYIMHLLTKLGIVARNNWRYHAISFYRTCLYIYRPEEVKP